MRKLFKNVSKNISMRYAHRITVTVFLKSEDIFEDSDASDKIISSMKYLVPLDLEKEKINLNIINAEGFSGREIKIFEIMLLKESHTNIFLDNLKGLLGSDQISLLMSQRWSRLDENLDLFIRLSKAQLFEKKALLTDSGDCFHIRIGIAAFPRRRETALNIIEKIFGNQ